MLRTVDDELLRWKRSDRRKPLLVRGARQVGKSYTIAEFGRKNFDNFVMVDLEKKLQAHRAFGEDLDARKVIGNLEVVTGSRIEPGKTLLFLDEIQACPRALTALRYLYEELPGLHVAAAGSLLELAVGEASFPVGRLQMLEMRPMSFSEFVLALGNERALEILRARPRKVPDAAHQSLLELLRTYGFVGGMPESVADFAEHRSLPRCMEILDGLKETIRQDFPKYAARANTGCLGAVLESAPGFVGQQLKYSRLTDRGTGPTIKKAFELLEKARMVTRVKASGAQGLPLGAGVSAGRFKAIMLDVGLWQRLAGLRLDREFAAGDLLDIHRGALAEQFVGQEILAARGGELHYWSREAPNSQAEVDYLVSAGGDIYGVEVKSGAAGRLRSLHLLLAEHPNVKGGLVFSSRPYEYLPEQKLTFLPVYYAGSACP
ncbi:MAG: nuclease [Elusimicrobia bacterium GWA2_69_24]|nr:MAG: nuclease [Elusimicrobia bacterium GWA2_69_24]HBL16940.1 nuclease [Elusimicrobiota bacterium]